MLTDLTDGVNWSGMDWTHSMASLIITKNYRILGSHGVCQVPRRAILFCTKFLGRVSQSNSLLYKSFAMSLLYYYPE